MFKLTDVSVVAEWLQTNERQSVPEAVVGGTRMLATILLYKRIQLYLYLQ